MTDKIETYFDQLLAAASEKEVSLLKAFITAGCSDGTYYRTRNGATELRFQTAQKVFDAIGFIYAKRETENKPASTQGEGVTADSARLSKDDGDPACS